MRTFIAVITLGVIGGGLAVADTPSPPVAADVAASASASPPAASATPEDADAELKRMRSLGYTAETRGGVRMYCRNEAQLGSRFPRKTCGTAADVARATRASKDAIGEAQRRSSSQPVGH